MTATRFPDLGVDRLAVTAYTVPTEAPESDGTLEWSSTTLVLVEAHAGERTGLGYTYGSAAAQRIVRELLEPHVRGADALAPAAAWEAMMRAVRNAGAPGVAATAIAAVDLALWDLKARLLDLPLVRLLGQVRSAVPIYGSGGFTSQTVAALQSQLAGWAEQGMRWVKMKVGRSPDEDPARVGAARAAIGEGSGLFVDANGAYSARQALGMAERFAPSGVSWFEEPVSSDDLEGLRLLRRRAPAGMEIVAGEYAHTLDDLERLVGAVDVLTPDITRCLGLTGFLKAAALAEVSHLPLASHCAPAQHLHPSCATSAVRVLEHFSDHARLERMFFEGAPEPRAGALAPDLGRPGNGLEVRRADVARFAL